jgi:hypothetical protein
MWAIVAAGLMFWTCIRTDVPFLLDQDRGGIIVPVVVNGRAGTALLDTGAGHTVVSPQLLGVSHRLNSGSFSMEQPGFVAQRAWARAPLRLGDADVGLQSVQAMDMAEVSRAYRRNIDALIGQDVLTRFGRVVIDFEARRLLLLRGEFESCPAANTFSQDAAPELR